VGRGIGQDRLGLRIGTIVRSDMDTLGRLLIRRRRVARTGTVVPFAIGPPVPLLPSPDRTTSPPETRALQ
jgi:hypothetical protein